MSHDVFVECGMWEIFKLFPSCHNGSSLPVFIIYTVIFVATPQKPSVGMYSRYNYPCVCVGRGQALSHDFTMATHSEHAHYNKQNGVSDTPINR